jgi:hypothetical protein
MLPGRSSGSIPGSSTEKMLARATGSGQFSFFTTSFTTSRCYSARHPRTPAGSLGRRW